MNVSISFSGASLDEVNKQIVAAAAGIGGEAAAPAKRGRPAKDQSEAAAGDKPAESDTTITADHPKRAELKKVATEYAELTSKADAQSAMKLFGPDGSKSVPDSELAGAVKHFLNQIKKVSEAKKKPAEDDAI